MLHASCFQRADRTCTVDYHKLDDYHRIYTLAVPLTVTDDVTAVMLLLLLLVSVNKRDENLV